MRLVTYKISCTSLYSQYSDNSILAINTVASRLLLIFLLRASNKWFCDHSVKSLYVPALILCWRQLCDAPSSGAIVVQLVGCQL